MAKFTFEYEDLPGSSGVREFVSDTPAARSGAEKPRSLPEMLEAASEQAARVAGTNKPRRITIERGDFDSFGEPLA